MSATFEEKYKDVLEIYAKAKIELINGEIADSLFHIRKALEKSVRLMCRQCGFDLQDASGTIKLIDLIDWLRENGIFSDEDVSLLHQIRKLGNKGSHDSDPEYDFAAPTRDEAQAAVNKFAQAIELFKRKDDESVFSAKREETNVPMVFPDYYSPTRKYIGAWFDKTKKEDLLIIPEYARLLKKATNGNISAMLDLAAGFCSKKIAWHSEFQGLMDIPKGIYMIL